MRVKQGAYDLVLPLRRVDGLETDFGHALFLPLFTDRRSRSLAAEERPGSVRVPGAALVRADPACAGGEHRVPHRIERVGRNEDDELSVHVSLSLQPGTSSSWQRSRSIRATP